MNSCISSKDYLFICIDRSSSTYERNISLQIYSTIYDFSDSLTNTVDICCFDTQINHIRYNLDKNNLKKYSNKYLRPLPPPPIKKVGKGTNLSLAIKFVTENIIKRMKCDKNIRVVGLIFTDDESHKFKEDEYFNIAKYNCNEVKKLGGELIIIQMLPSNIYPNSSLILSNKFNLNPNQIISFVDTSPNSTEIYKICSRSLQILNSRESQKSFSVSLNLNEKLFIENDILTSKDDIVSSNNYNSNKNYLSRIMKYFKLNLY